MMARSKDERSDTSGAESGPAATGVKARGKRTRERILEAALALFQERGYDETTMRGIAERAGVSSTNTYYYFAGKQELLDALAQQLHDEYLDACRPLLARESELEARLGGVLEAYWVTLQRYAPVAFELLMLATDPRSPLNLFGSHQSRRREAEIALIAEVVGGSLTTIHREIAPVLPTVLWLYHLGLRRLWLHDSTPNRERTRRRTNESVKVVADLIEVLLRPKVTAARGALVQVCAALGIVDVAATVSTEEGEDGTWPG